ncbi:hypothetical protein LAZ67_5002532 [Cordylochernes scorpioides]|uniref:Helitron helicase-like domain-containing protein n=1 Tax=Cordylochernes scorpioides TaxID=51811 RepID=A0ABY6KJJ3_9ARAC|nr:hypothetical protein LAZ67_5002532 [Cordylochernes scorpioides]
MKVINSKWVYSMKKTSNDGIYIGKARLVAVGCNQRYGVDYKESFLPILKKESLRTIIAIATKHNLIIKTYDVKTAYLYGEKKDSEPFIGIEIKRAEDGFYLSHYIDTILNRFGLEECNSVQTPGDQNQNLNEYSDSKPVVKTVYQEMIGSLMYLSTGTRPDLSFNVSNLSQYSNDPREIPLTAVNMIYRYLKGTRNKMLVYKSKDNNITISTDASWCTPEMQNPIQAIQSNLAATPREIPLTAVNMIYRYLKGTRNKIIVDITRKQRRHCDDGDRLKFAAPPLLTLGHRICIMGPKKYKTEEERKQAKAEQDKLRYENINQKEAASAQNGDISARAKRLQKIAASQRKRRLDESLEVRVERLNQDAESHRRQRENESELETAARLQNIAASQRKRRLDESLEVRVERLNQDAESHRRQRENESELETAARLQNIAASQRKRRLDESLEVRVERLNQDAESHRRQRENESELETAARLQNIAASQRKRRLDESLEVRVKRLNQDAESHRRQRENESELETAARLQNIAASQRKRRLDESELETAARLQNIAASQRKRRLGESLEVRVKRLNQDAESHRRQRENESELETAARRENDRQIHIRRHQNQSINLRRHRQQSADLVTEDENSVVEHTCGLMSVICLYCGSHNFLAERPLDGKFTQCCQKGKVVLHQNKYPILLEDLMKQRHQHSKNFLENIRSINSSFAFASMGAQVSPPPGYGPYCFRIQGQIYHRTGTLHPEDGEGRKFAQLYILDTEVATEERLKLKENQGCNKDLMNAVATLLQQINTFTEAYRMLGDVEKEEERKAKENNTELPSIVMAIKQDRKQDHRRYNNPRVSEVAVIFESDDGEPPFQRDILIHLRPDPLDPFSPNTQRISLLHRNLDALLYPLFYPRGEQGWHDQIWQVSTAKPHRVTQLQFYSYCLSKINSFNPLLNGGKLTQQFIVDAYVKIEANRLNYVRMNQKDLRVEDYCVVQQHLENRAIQNGIPIGKMVILPSSFEGSPRNMQQRYQDAMAIVEKHGKPDLFVTMTCNPKWKDITDNLEDWQRVEHRPDLIARVFKLKLEQLLK